jgi:uncharacterized protein YggT (Ycf19 family)
MERRETEVVRDETAGTVREESHVISESPTSPAAESADVVSSRVSPGRRGVEVIYLVFGIINGLLLIRLVLKLLAANPHAGFATFIYSTTDVFLAPFKSLLPTTTSGSSVFEMSVVVAIIVYALIAWVLARLVSIMLSRSVTVAHRTSSRGVKPRPE